MPSPTLATPPTHEQDLELWLQHAAGKLLLDATRERARSKLAQRQLGQEAHQAALQSIDDAVYGLMQLLDGVSDPLANDDVYVGLRTTAELRRASDDAVLHAVDLLHGDGMCMGWHGWVEGDFGELPVTKS
ncbi:MAG: hypothetical protein LBJ15_23215 [Comamonas sp.]|jgi:hypothetical protein|uniref:hypothetical protein n=1 Tax=Comamonas sp. TaxID=34028 RepID=UPI00281BFDB8|nr:hypothetical protein [Comamonas sp.]MDR0216897.1 hypothetical protein [Comamonas sp.]MDR2299309.1 hypothetical protein [Comamonas sp.]